MKHPIRPLSLVLAIAVATPASALAQPLVFSPVTVIDVREGVARPDMTVVVTGERITDFGKTGSVEIPAGALVVDATDKYLIPGLWDMYAHIVSDNWVLPLLRVNGITGLRSMHGAERIQDVKEKRNDGNYLGFEFSYSSPIVDGPPGLWSGSLIAATPEEGRAAVRKLHAAGYDFVKVYSNLSRETYFAIAEEAGELRYPFAGHVPWSVTAIEAIAAGQKSIEHMVGLGFLVQKPDELQRLIRNRDPKIVGANGKVDLFKWFDHVLQHHDATRLPLLMEATAGSGTWFCPTLVSLQASAYSSDSAFADDDRLKYVPEEELDFWRTPLESGEFPEEFANRNEWHFELSQKYYHTVLSLLKPMVDAGAQFLAGTDIGNPYLYPGFSLHDELALLVEAGFTPLEALQTATLNPALYLGRATDLGTVEEHKIANLVLLDADPLEDISNTQRIQSMVVNGRYFGRQTLDELLKEAEKAANVLPVKTANAQDANRYAGPIIDMHLHAYDPEDLEGEEIFCANEGLVEFPPIDPAENAHMDDAMACPNPLQKAASEADNQDRHRAIMERYNIHGVLDVTQSNLAQSMAKADDWQASAPGRYWIAIDPYDAYSPPAEELEKLFTEGRFQLFAELTPQYVGTLATDPKFEPYFALAERLDIPVGLHLGEGPPGVTRTLPGTRYSPALGRPLDLAPLLQQYPKLRLYVMHYGSPLVEEMLAMLHAFPGLYVDLAGNNWKMPRPYFHAQLKRFVDAGFSQRLMFGSDSLIWPDALPVAIDAIKSAPFLSEEQKADIFYNNAARFLRLSEEEIARHHAMARQTERER